jgi:hypothetical protein
MENKPAEPCPKCGEHCYARLLNEAGTSKVYDEKRFCPDCKAHLSASGICLNACHLTVGQFRRFEALLSSTRQGKT